MAIGTVWADDTWDDDAWADDTWADADTPPTCTPPTNISAPTATNIPSFPASITQDVHCAPTTYTVWYEFTAPVAGLVHIFGFGGSVGSAYQPRTEAYLGPSGGPTSLVFGDENRPIQLQVAAGTQYFLEINTNAGNPSPAILTLTLEYLTPGTMIAGDLIVNDDTELFPAVVLSPSVDYEVRRSFPDVVAGEQGDALDSNIMAFTDEWNQRLVTYSPTFTEIASIDVSSLGLPFIRNMNGTKFYVGFDAAAGDVTVRDLLASGAFGAVSFTLTGTTSLRAIAPNNDETILYYAAAGSNVPIKRWDIVNNIGLSDLVAGTSGYFIVDLLVMVDGSIVAMFDNISLSEVRVYSPAGALLATIPFTTEHPAFTFPRLSHSSTRQTFWVMSHGDGVGIYTHYALAGTVIDTVTHAEYEGGIYTGAETEDPPLFGASFSCPLVVVRGVAPDPDPDPDPDPEPPEPPTTCPGGGLPIFPGSANGNGCVQCAAPQ